MEHVISVKHAPAIAANPPGDVKNTSVLEQPIVVFGVVVGGVGVLVGCTDEVAVTRSGGVGVFVGCTDGVAVTRSGGVGVLVGCTDGVAVTRSYPRRVNPALA